MSRVLVTGSAGFIGRRVMGQLTLEGHDAVGFDLAANQDVQDFDALRTSVAGCRAVIHLADAAAGTDPHRIVRTNVGGFDNVIRAAAEANARRIVLISSAQVLGIFMGEARPDYFPIDESHPVRPTSAYGQSKLAMERSGQRSVTELALEVICLRPPGVCDDATRQWIRLQRNERPSFEWDPIWEYGAWIHLDDFALACVAACFCPSPVGGFASVAVAAMDNNSDKHSSRELARQVHPDVEWRGGPEYRGNARLTLYRPDAAMDLLRWRPSTQWC